MTLLVDTAIAIQRQHETDVAAMEHYVCKAAYYGLHARANKMLPCMVKYNAASTGATDYALTLLKAFNREKTLSDDIASLLIEMHGGYLQTIAEKTKQAVFQVGK